MFDPSLPIWHDRRRGDGQASRSVLQQGAREPAAGVVTPLTVSALAHQSFGRFRLTGPHVGVTAPEGMERREHAQALLTLLGVTLPVIARHALPQSMFESRIRSDYVISAAPALPCAVTLLGSFVTLVARSWRGRAT